MEHKLHYKRYCQILSEVIKEGKKRNKMKSTWNIINKETNKLTNEKNVKSLRINKHILYNQITLAKEINNYFLNIVLNTSNKRINEKEDEASPLQNLFKYFHQPFKDNKLALHLHKRNKQNNGFTEG